MLGTVPLNVHKLLLELSIGQLKSRCMSGEQSISLNRLPRCLGVSCGGFGGSELISRCRPICFSFISPKAASFIYSRLTNDDELTMGFCSSASTVFFFLKILFKSARRLSWMPNIFEFVLYCVRLVLLGVASLCF